MANDARREGLDVARRRTPIVPMFHANTWSINFSAAISGASLVLPGPKLDGASIYELLDRYKVTCSAGVPTVWLMLLQHLAATGNKLPYLKKIVIGGPRVRVP